MDGLHLVTLGVPGEAIVKMNSVETGASSASSEIMGVEAVSGSVKWFDTARGYGFLAADDGNGDVLVHFSVLRDVGRRSLPEGARVECMVQCGDRKSTRLNSSH